MALYRRTTLPFVVMEFLHRAVGSSTPAVSNQSCFSNCFQLVFLHHPVPVCASLPPTCGSEREMTPDPAKWADLRVFLEGARQRSGQAAAKRVGGEHSTVCRRVDKLESLLSVKLFDRTRK